MFGQGSKKKKLEAAEFDLEKDLKSDPGKERSIKQRLEARVQGLKTTMRQGTEKKAFEDAQVLLNAYLAAQKVAARVKRKLS